MNKSFLLAVVLSAASLFPFGILLSSLNSISQTFNVSYDYVYYSVVLYLFMSAFVSLFFGLCIDYYGKKRMLLIAFSIFIASSLLCALSTNIDTYFVGRVLQASIVGAFTISLMLIKETYSKNKLTLKLNHLSLIDAIFPIVATVLGGLLNQLCGWRMIFWVLFVVYTVVAVLITRLIDDDAIGPNRNRKKLFSQYLQIVNLAKFWHYAIINALCMAVFFIFIASAPAFLANTYHINSVNTGIIMSLPPLGFVLSCLFSERLFQSYSWNQKILFGRIIVFSGLILGLISRNNTVYAFANLAICGFFIGLGNGLSTPNLRSAIISIQDRMLGSIIGLFSFFSSLLGAVISVSYSFFPIDYENIFLLYIVLFIPASLGLLAALLLFFSKETKTV